MQGVDLSHDKPMTVVHHIANALLSVANFIAGLVALLLVAATRLLRLGERLDAEIPEWRAWPEASW